MLRRDARGSQYDSNYGGEINTINLDSVAKIEKQLQDNPYDMISLVFLLYDVPDTALQRLIVYQRVMGDESGTNMNLLQEWFRHASNRPNWQHELVEALLICQLNNIVKGLGFHVPNMKKYYQSNDPNVSKYINPAKKILYHACESMSSDNLMKLKKSLLSYDIDVTDYMACEVIFLELLSKKFITIKNIGQIGKTKLSWKCDVENLVKILDNLHGLKKIAFHLRCFQSKCNDKEMDAFETSSEFNTSSIPPNIADDKLKQDDKKYGTEHFNELFDMINEISISPENNFKSDTLSLKQDQYDIKNPEELGVCLIINQENFYPSRNSIEDEHQIDPLEERKGSSMDKRKLEKTMASLKFNVQSCSDLNHVEMMEFIKKNVHKHVTINDSIFVLCILSHGVRGHVYAADSVKVKVESIQNILDSDEMKHLRGIPKVFIIQACQVDEKSSSPFVADSSQSIYYAQKSDFLIFWATAPEYEAYRHEKIGSLFIQALCELLQHRAKCDDLYEIFTKVNDYVTNLCTHLKRAQVPIFNSTLRHKLYLHALE